MSDHVGCSHRVARLCCPRCHLAVLKSRTSTFLSTHSLSILPLPLFSASPCQRHGQAGQDGAAAGVSLPLLLLSQATLPAAARHGRTAASHRGLDSSRLAVHCTEARSAAAWCCRARPAVAWPWHHQAGCQHTSSTGAPQPWPAPRRRTARPPPW